MDKSLRKQLLTAQEELLKGNEEIQAVLECLEINCNCFTPAGKKALEAARRKMVNGFILLEDALG